MNATACTKIEDGKEVNTTWADIEVGDIIKSFDDDCFPADLIVIGSSHKSVNSLF